MMLSRAAVAQRLLSLFPSPSYLEVGVFGGDTFFQIEAASKVAVDPLFQFDPQARHESHVVYHQVTSDEYFGKIIDPARRFEVIYLDGLHTLEQTLRDFTNSIRYLAPGGVVLIDDILPRNYQSSLRTMNSSFLVGDFVGSGDRAWMGDTYKLAYFIETFFQQFSFNTVADNEGQLVVWENRRDSVPDRTVESVGRMTFEELVHNYASMRRVPLDDIMIALKDRPLPK